MKIIYLLAALGSGGAERVVSILANRMCENGHDIQIICLKYNVVFYSIHEKVSVVKAMEHTANRFTEFYWLRHYIKKEKPDVVIPFTEGVYCFTIASLLGTGIPVIASERLDPAAMSLPRKILKRLLLPFADWLVVQTQTIKDYFPKHIQEKTSVILNPVRDDIFNDNGNSYKKQGIRCKENRIISVGRLYPQKNQKMMIEAFSKIVGDFPDWQLVIFGEGPLRAELESLVSSFKLQGRVLLPGKTEQVIEELRKSKVFCLSSDYEGMSNAMIEALCVGTPVISTKVSGTDELIRDEENGLLVDIGDTEGLAQAFEKLLNNQELREQLGKEGQKLATQFKTDTIVDQWEYLIKRFIIKGYKGYS